MGERRTTSTSNFGVGRRESHDATAFYARFEGPELSKDATVAAPTRIRRPFVAGDARHMKHLPDNSVALVVTSPPYFAGKQYEEELGRDGVPGSYVEYLELLRDVFAECKRVLEPGGRIAVNVANLGRKPYRSLSSDVIHILQDELKLLLRGEVIWKKADGASGSCAWGSFRSPANPVLRDITERVVIASKGRFDRARTTADRRANDLPHGITVTSDEFMEATLDVWELAPESARRVGHPAPFPVELPERLIHLYTYAGDLVLDPFMGSGSTLVAASRLQRRYIGYDLDPAYVAIAKQRVAAEGKATSAVVPEGKSTSAIAEQALTDAGFEITHRNHRVRGAGLAVDVVARDAEGQQWYFDVCGSYAAARGGLLRTDEVWRSLGRATVLGRAAKAPYVLLATHLPKRPGEGDTALRAAGPTSFFDAVELLSDDGRVRLEKYAQGKHHTRPAVGFWSDAELDAPA